MPGLLSKLELFEAVETIFSAGVSEQRFLGLSEGSAKRYQNVLDLNGYRTKLTGPSLNNDPAGINHLYSLIVKNRNSGDRQNA